MRYLPREIESLLLKASRTFPALMVTGPRRAGKTTLLRHLFKKASYHLLEDPDVIARVQADPRSFLDDCQLPVILDEVQNVPELLNYIRSRIDSAPRRKGQWLLTGSQEAPLMKGVTESMAGRIALFQILPFSILECKRVSLHKGGFPEVIAHPGTSSIWFRSYIQTYLERDVRAVSAVSDLATFRRFLTLLATRTGQILNKTDLAGPLGVSVPTIGAWLGILEVTGQILLVQPFFENFGKRLIKSPKIYFVDSGLVCHLLGMDKRADLEKSTFFGSLFEGFVAAEIAKAQINAGRAREIYYFRDQQGLEIDFVVSRSDRSLALIEAKTTKSIFPRAASTLKRLEKAISDYSVESFVIHRSSSVQPSVHIAPLVKALSLENFLKNHLR